MQQDRKVAEKEASDSSGDHDSDNDDGNRGVILDTSKIQKLKTKLRFILNPSYQSCDRLRFGRLSYKGMNLEIETIMYNNGVTHDKWDTDSSFESSKARGEKRPAELDWHDEEDEYE